MSNDTNMKVLVDKWKPILDSGDGISDDYTRETTAVLLENQARHCLLERQKDGLLNEDTTVGQLGTFQKFAFPIVRRVFPELIANNVVGVQPMQGPVSQVFYLGYDRKSRDDSTKFQNVYGKYNLTYRGQFPDHTNEGANLSSLDAFPATIADDLSGVAVSGGTGGVGPGIAKYPDTTSLLQWTTSAGEKLGLRDVSGGWEFDGTSNSGVDNRWDVAPIPEIDFHIETQSVEAATRKFRALWTIEASQDLKAYHNLDLERELTDLLSKEVQIEIDRELIENLRMIAYDISNATGIPVGGWRRQNLQMGDSNNFTGLGKSADGNTNSYQYDHNSSLAGNPAGTDRNVFFVDLASTAMPDAPQHVGHIYSNILAALNFASNDIYKTTYRGPGNWFICSPLVAAMLESAAKLSDGVADNATAGGVAYKGKFAGKYDMYVDPLYPEDEILVGYKGASPMDAGLVYAPYIPLQLLPTVTDPETFQPRKGILTRYGIVAIAPESRFYRVIRFVGGNASRYLSTPFARMTDAFGEVN